MSYHKVARMCPPTRAVHGPGMVRDGFDILATHCMLPAIPGYLAGGRRLARAPAQTRRVFSHHPTTLVVVV